MSDKRKPTVDLNELIANAPPPEPKRAEPPRDPRRARPRKLLNRGTRATQYPKSN